MEEFHNFQLPPLELDPELLVKSYEPKNGVFTEDYRTLGKFNHPRQDLCDDWEEKLANEKSVTAKFLLEILENPSYYNTLGNFHHYKLFSWFLKRSFKISSCYNKRKFAGNLQMCCQDHQRTAIDPHA